VLLDRVLETPQARGLFEQMQDLIDRAGNAIDPAARPIRPPLQQRRTPPPPAQPAPPPRPDPRQIARLVMHFGPAEPLSKDKISKQRRSLAAICHPDKGGSTEAMQRLNRAADLLLAEHK